MDRRGPMPTTSSRRIPSPQKLKDTCDMCTASKVRCDKEKPICSRCDKLDYPCFYSPARRMGRPHPPRTTSSQKKPGVALESPERQPIIRPRDEGVELGSDASFDEAQSSHEHDIRKRTVNKLQGSENDFNNDAVLDFRRPAISQNGQMKWQHTDHYIPKGSPRPTRKDRVEATAMFDLDDRVNRANSIEVDGSYYQAISSDDASTLLPNTSYHSSSTLSTIDPLSEILAHREDSSSNASEYDCATVVMNMLQHLNAVCAAILDIHGIVLRDFTRSTIHYSPTDKPTHTTASLVNDVINADRIEFCTASLQDGSNEKATMMRVLEELPKVANLVMQFTKRYSQNVEESPAEFLPALADSSPPPMMPPTGSPRSESCCGQGGNL